MSEDRQCSSCGGFCKKSGRERENVEHKKWVGLTDDEVEEVYEEATVFNTPMYFAIAIEAKLKEKNT